MDTTLVGIVRSFLQSPAILQNVRGQSAKVDPFRGVIFDGSPIENPLRFIEAHTLHDPSVAKSLWMLARLAFDTPDTEPVRLEGIHR